jgi:N-acetyl-anhydromuramyl-L-alanine amidase AmpD
MLSIPLQDVSILYHFHLFIARNCFPSFFSHSKKNISACLLHYCIAQQQQQQQHMAKEKNAFQVGIIFGRIV